MGSTSRSRTLQRRPTLADIARQLGLSTMTVSRSISGHPAVTEETRRSVLRKAEELGYRPNRWARGLVTQRSMMVGVVVPDISHAFYSEVTLGIQQTLEPHGYGLLLCNSGRDTPAEVRAIEALLSYQVEGLLIASNQPEDALPYFQDVHRRQGTPLVFIDRSFPTSFASSLTTDDLEVGRLATLHLISLGHTRVAHIGGSRTSVGRLRAEGYRSAMEEHQLHPNPAWVIEGISSVEAGFQAGKLLLQGKDRPTAIFAASDYAAFGVARACGELGLQIPGDLSLAGAGDIEGDQHPRPFLTTVRWDRHELGRQAAAVLLEHIQRAESARPRRIIFPPRLIVRQSSGRLSPN